MTADRADRLRAQILDLVREYHDAAFAESEFVAPLPRKSPRVMAR